MVEPEAASHRSLAISAAGEVVFAMDDAEEEARGEAEKVIQLRASAAANERIGLLAGKSAAGTLSHDEREEYEAFLLLVQSER
jgi:hypothetical protein